MMGRAYGQPPPQRVAPLRIFWQIHCRGGGLTPALRRAQRRMPVKSHARTHRRRRDLVARRRCVRRQYGSRWMTCHLQKAA